MLLHYQSTYSTLHVCHPVYSGYRRPHLPHHSLLQSESSAVSDWWLISELISSEGWAYMHAAYAHRDHSDRAKSNVQVFHWHAWLHAWNACMQLKPSDWQMKWKVHRYLCCEGKTGCIVHKFVTISIPGQIKYIRNSLLDIVWHNYDLYIYSMLHR